MTKVNLGEATLPKLYEDLELATVVSGSHKQSNAAVYGDSSHLSFD
eukprot:CAMPEP_0116872956 /NCGR_PEP_ID=MMETSP0463-20121206/3901_1 /TAXON_ID=181622 /ORGANISM="Strombidinopsis sp, Strain SopsisLIS2011" /LENGTH=45 /DNA_ID= /DNA_START= /DNA_END= /DNA_ORIENTATION=